MKKILILLLAAVMLLACVSACAKNDAPANSGAPSSDTGTQTPDTDAQTPDEQPQDASKSFVVGFDAEFPPFGFIAADGSYDGFDLAVAEEVCNRKGWNFVAQPIAWDSKDAELASGNIDCIWNGFTYEGRENDYSWTPAYYDSSIVMVVRADSDISSSADLEGKNVITQAASSALSALQNLPTLTDSFAQLIETADYNSAFMELEMGTADAVAADIGVAKYNMAGKEDKFVVLSDPISVETYAIGFLKGNDALAAEVWETVLAIAADGTMSAIADDYVDYGLVKENICIIDIE